MRTTRAALVIAALLALAGCKQVADQKSPHDFPTATMKWGNSHAWTDSIYREVGRYSMFQAQYQDVLFGDFRVERLHKENKRALVGIYAHAHSVFQWEIKHVDSAVESPYRDWARMGLANLAWTTERDTARNYNNAWVITVNDSSTVRQMVAVLEKWVKRSPNGSAEGLSWMLDYLTVPMQSYVYGEQARQMHGLLDMDRDGVAHLEDEDEQQAVRDGYCYLIDLLRERLPHIKILANGMLPYRDHDLMKRLDGVYMEGGFRWGFGMPYITNALAGEPPYLFSEIVKWYRPGGYSVLEAQFYSPQAMAMALMLDGPQHRVYAVVKPRDGTRTLAPDPLLTWDVGAPVEPVKVDGLTLTRTFERGAATMRITSGYYPNPFDFEIRDHDGRLITEVGQ